jgi:hypothetical protein
MYTLRIFRVTQLTGLWCKDTVETMKAALLKAGRLAVCRRWPDLLTAPTEVQYILLCEGGTVPGS